MRFNKHSVQIAHILTGITATVDNERHQYLNRQSAMNVLKAWLHTAKPEFMYDVKAYTFTDDVISPDDNEDYLTEGSKLK